MKQLSLLIIFFVILIPSFGQQTFKRNDIYFEAGGNGLFGSVNYERQLTKEAGLGARIGVGFYKENAFYLSIPAGLNYLFKLKKDNAFIDAGLGLTLTRKKGDLFGNAKDNDDDHFVNFIPSIGYRNHAVKNLMWRINISAVANKYTLLPWLGFSFGKRF